MKYLNLLKFVSQYVVKPFQHVTELSSRGKGSVTPYRDKITVSNEKNSNNGESTFIILIVKNRMCVILWCKQYHLPLSNC